MTATVTGPASYFPSIEQTYGRPIGEWKALMRATQLTSHKQLVNWLKAEHGFGHGHATAITMHLLAESTESRSDDERIASLFPEKKSHWREVYDRLVRELTTLGDVRIMPKNTKVGIATRAQFVMLQPATPGRFDVGLKLPGVPPTRRLEEAGRWDPIMTHRVRLTDPREVDAELLGWLRQAYERSLR